MKGPRLEALIKSCRSYHWNMDGVENAMSKTFNHGMGSLILAQYIPGEDIVLVNSAIARNRDYERITNAFPSSRIEKVELGYPEYYFHRSLLSRWRQ